MIRIKERSIHKAVLEKYRFFHYLLQEGVAVKILVLGGTRSFGIPMVQEFSMEKVFFADKDFCGAINGSAEGTI